MDNKDILYVLPALVVTFVSTATKMVQAPLIQSRDTMMKSYHEGLIHITSEEAANSIINSKEVYASVDLRLMEFIKDVSFLRVFQILKTCVSIVILGSL